MISRERSSGLWLRCAVILACVVPVGAGAAGVWLGPGFVSRGTVGPSDLDGHFRYLSGLLLGIGLGFLSTVPRIETHTARFRTLAAIVVLGGIGRLIGVAVHGIPSAPMMAALVMELGVTPALAVWQSRVARASAGA